jgi:hypothetical protein
MCLKKRRGRVDTDITGMLMEGYRIMENTLCRTVHMEMSADDDEFELCI